MFGFSFFFFSLRGREGGGGSRCWGEGFGSQGGPLLTLEPLALAFFEFPFTFEFVFFFPILFFFLFFFSLFVGFPSGYSMGGRRREGKEGDGRKRFGSDGEVGFLGAEAGRPT
jgi:hypothetical protein